jgi:hypothetical protein
MWISGTIGVVRYNSEILHDRVDEIVKECRNFHGNKREYFSAQWFSPKKIENTKDVKIKHIDIIDKDALYNVMSSSQNYNPNDEEKNYYNEFFNKKTITAEDGDLIAIAYRLDTEEYEYEDVALYDRTKKLLILKDENNEIKFIEKNVDSIFE